MSDASKFHYSVNAKICRLVAQYPCMYDRSHINYSKKDVMDQAWLNISKEMGDSIPSCKERWRNIRTSYARSINVNKVPASANRTKPYYLHEELQFLAAHITPGIPVSRRSVFNSFNGTSKCNTSTPNAKGDIPKTSSCDESVDSYNPAMKEETEDKSQHNQEDCSDSVASDATSKNTQEMEQDLLSAGSASQSQQSPNNLLPNEDQEVEFHPPVIQIEEDNSAIQVENAITRKDSINYACAPPKKRLKVKDNCYASDNFTETKPLDLTPQHDYDDIFLRGLLPEMKAMDFRQKIIFKRRIYEVLGEIFENSEPTSSITSNQLPQTSSQAHLQDINSPDLNVLRRLNNLLQDPSASLNTSTGISSTVLSSSPATSFRNSATTAKIGATTRSSTNMSRGRLATSYEVMSSQDVKEETEIH